MLEGKKQADVPHLIFNNFISQTCIVYELSDSGQGVEHRVGYHKLTSNKCEWNNCFINTKQLTLFMLRF